MLIGMRKGNWFLGMVLDGLVIKIEYSLDKSGTREIFLAISTEIILRYVEAGAVYYVLQIRSSVITAWSIHLRAQSIAARSMDLLSRVFRFNSIVQFSYIDTVTPSSKAGPRASSH